VEQQIRFCTTPDGVRLGYAIRGRGPPIVRVATWLTHLDYDLESPVWRHWVNEFADGHQFVRYDERGCGLSDREVGDLSIDAWVTDLETVIDDAGLDRFALLGISQGAAISVVYAVRHPERVTHLVLYGGYLRGRHFRGVEAQREEKALISVIRAGWTDPDPTFRHLFSMLFLPYGTAEQMSWYDAMQRRSTSASIAARLFEARGKINVAELAPAVTAPTLVAHARGDRGVPVEEGRLLGALIPGARLVLLESDNHILLEDEPAWPRFVSEVRSFLGTSRASVRPSIGALSRREREVLEASSGNRRRHRLTRRGNRQLNYALHVMAVVQICHHGPGYGYYQRKLAEGKTTKEALRCLKRRLSDVVYRQLLADQRCRQGMPPDEAREDTQGRLQACVAG
jgi:pimeloyl-ACP methyl ester carboxylesterase